MTIIFKASWNGYEQGTVHTLGSTEEARLIAAGIAAAHTATAAQRIRGDAVVNQAGQLVMRDDTGGGSSIAVGSVVSGYGTLSTVGDSLLKNGTNIFPTSQSHIAWAFGQMRGISFSITERAVGGSTIDQMITNQLPNALTDDTSGIWIHSGVNNLNPGIDATTPTVSEIGQRMARAVAMAAAGKDYVILDAITPLAEGSISGAYPRRTDIPLVNSIYQELADKYQNVIFNDIYTTLARDASSGLAVAGYMIASDGIHFATRDAATAGIASVQALRQIAFRKRFRPSTVYALPEITGSGGTTTPSTGTINGTVATGYNVQIASNATGVVVTAEVLADGKQRMRIQNGNAASSVVRLNLASYTDYLTGLASGDLVQASCLLEVVAASGLYRHDLSVQQNPSGSAYNITSMLKSAAEDGSGDSFPVFPAAPYALELKPHGALTATPTSVNVAMSIEVAPGGDVTVDVSQITFREVIAV